MLGLNKKYRNPGWKHNLSKIAVPQLDSSVEKQQYNKPKTYMVYIVVVYIVFVLDPLTSTNTPT